MTNADYMIWWLWLGAHLGLLALGVAGVIVTLWKEKR